MHKKPARSQTCDGDLRQRSLEAAAQLFYAHDIRAAGVDLVVEKAAVVKSSLCRRFGTKGDLVAALLERLLPRLSRATFYLQRDVVETAL
ncbi:MAG TPA: helix-turn-helix domain-containing protein [Bryobacteraceae bacterium]